MREGVLAFVVAKRKVVSILCSKPGMSSFLEQWMRSIHVSLRVIERRDRFSIASHGRQLCPGR